MIPSPPSPLLSLPSGIFLPRIALALTLLFGTVGCETMERLPGTGEVERHPPPPPAAVQSSESAKVSQDTALSRSIDSGSKGSRAPHGWEMPGTDRFVRSPTGAQPQRKAVLAKDQVVLNFENSDIRAVVKVILGDMLHRNYLIDPNVRGSVTMQTAAPLSRADLLPTLETLLRMNGATLVETDGRYQVVPLGKAEKGLLMPRLADGKRPLPPGAHLVIRPLRHISAEEMSQILKPLLGRNDNLVRVDPKRNLLVLSGTSRELKQILATIDTFDVNWLHGMSVGFFPVEKASLDQVQKELDVVLGSEGGKALGGLVRITPIPSANGFLVVSRRREYLTEVGDWIRRFDRFSVTDDEPRLFIYRVRNSKAENLAKLLNELFASGRKKSLPPPSLAPGRKAVTIMDTKKPKPDKPVAASKTTSSLPSSAKMTAAEVHVVADEEHNTLLIRATARDYQRMQDTLQKLDIIPLQVHIEATIVEVLLKGKLKYGISWFFKGGVDGYKSVGGVGGTTSGIDLTGGIKNLANGFNWSLIDSSGAVRAVLNAFANDSLVNVLSAPSVMVLDNQEAMIQVGDEVPTLTQRQGTEGNAVIESVSYRNTGIILKVKPRVNPGGLVTMEISQEVSAVANTDVATNQPTIQTRKISSTVAVQSGQTVVLGGLIRDKRTNAQGGAPVLYKLPVVGALFGETEKNSERVELVVVLTPRVITSAEDALHITEDFRTRMQGLKKEFLQEAGVLKRDRKSADKDR